MAIGVGDRVKRAKPLYAHSTRPEYKEPERLGTAIVVSRGPGGELVTVEWDQVRDPVLVGKSARRTMMRGSSLVVVEAAPQAVTTDNLRERLAAVQHDIWGHWMRWQFTQGVANEDGTFTIRANKVERWARQMYTDYANLSEQERESDREQADKVLALLAGKL